MLKETNIDGTILVVAQKERLTIDISTDFKHAMAEIVEKRGNRIVLDLSNVEFIDSSGLGALVAVKKSVHPDGSLTLCGINEQVLSLVKLTQLTKLFNIKDDYDQAQAA